MGKKLISPPVYFTVAQVRFNPLLKLSEFLPSIQDKLRQAGFPDFSSQKSVVLQVVLQDQLATPVPVAHERFQFGNLKKTDNFLLESQSLTLQSTAYGDFSRFSDIFLKGLSIVHDVVELSFTERIGLRYLNRVIPHDKDTLEKYLAPEVMGLSAKLPGKAQYSYSETLSSIDSVGLRSRVLIQDGGLGFPPDLDPEGMPVNPRLAQYTGHHAVIDNDGSIANREVFSVNDIAQSLQVIHSVASNALLATVTKHAFKTWDYSDE